MSSSIFSQLVSKHGIPFSMSKAVEEDAHCFFPQQGKKEIHKASRPSWDENCQDKQKSLHFIPHINYYKTVYLL